MNRRKFTASLLAAASGAGCRVVSAETLQPLVCTVILDAITGQPVVREGPCEERFSPCSSFKFAIAVMGFDAGILHDPHHPAIAYRPEFETRYDAASAHKTLDPSTWLRDSVVWYSQQVTSQLGRARFNSYVRQFNYGNEDVRGTPIEDGLTHAWLMNSLTISADEQARFVLAFVNKKLGVAATSYENTRQAMPIYSGDGGWEVHGKSGSGWLKDQSGNIDRNRPQGWFVGWAQRENKTVVFARLQIGTSASTTPGGARARAAILQDLVKLVPS